MFDKNNKDIFDKISNDLTEIERTFNKKYEARWYNSLSIREKETRSIYPFGMDLKKWYKK